MREQKGITLVALIITIIVLLILAMVSISLLMNDGIINRANNAVTAYQTAENDEQGQLNSAENYMINYMTTPAAQNS